MASANKLKKEILELTRDYSKLIFCLRPEGDSLRTEWKEGSVIPYAGRVFTEEEVIAAVSTTLDFLVAWKRRCSNGKRVIGFLRY